jgi:hypothetical protein
MSLRRQGKTKEISFVYSLIIIVFVFILSTSIIYYSAIKGEALNNDYSNLLIDRNRQLSDISSIILTSPRPNDLLGDNFVLSGKVKIFADKFYYRVSNSFDEVLLQGNSFIRLSGEYLPFLIEVNLDSNKITKRGKIEFYIINSFDGSEVELLSVPVNFITHLSSRY